MEFPYLDGKKPVEYSSLALAYIGDAVYEVYVRAYLLEGGNIPVNKLHKLSIGYVCAGAQSNIVHNLEEHLTEEEIAVYKRGRNAHSNTSAKNAGIVDYRHATGFEALIGYLFISKNYDRLGEIIRLSFEIANRDTEEESNE